MMAKSHKVYKCVPRSSYSVPRRFPVGNLTSSISFKRDIGSLQQRAASGEKVAGLPQGRKQEKGILVIETGWF